jgi:DNA-binding SARP family transcriptional activator
MREGNRSEAIRQYRLYRQILGKELGIEPSLGLSQMLSGLTPSR